jgi:hypothetical protein
MQLTQYFEDICAFDPRQSAYRWNHSCESAIAQVLNSIFSAADDRKVTFLTLLDLSSAFDTVDRDILMHKLISVGVRDNVLHWIGTYLSDRSQSVIIDSHTSTPAPLQYGVPQGSVLGPLLFIIYLSDISCVFGKLGIEYVIYADDIQFWISCSVHEAEKTVKKLTDSIISIKQWLASNMLVLNDSKTEVIVCGSPQLVSRVSVTDIHIGNICIPLSKKVRDLGVIIDDSMTFCQHITNISSSAFAYLRVIGRLRQSLSKKDCLMLVQSLVISRILYCSTIFNGISQKQMQRLQRIQNASLRLVELKSRSDSIADSFLTHKWLKVPKLIVYRSSVFTFSILKSQRPSYLYNLLRPYRQSRELRSINGNLLDTPRCLTRMGERSFSLFAPSVWNSIPRQVKEIISTDGFKAHLLNHLMTSE